MTAQSIEAPETSAATDPAAHVAVTPDTGAILPRDTYTYAVPVDLVGRAVPGARVLVPFGAREVVGYVLGSEQAYAGGEARSLSAVLEEPPILSATTLQLARWIAERYCAPLGEVIRAMLPKGVRSARPGGRKRGPRTTSAAVDATRSRDGAVPETPPPLTHAQRAAAAPLLEAVASGSHRRVLLHGVTGAGKTEVYLVAIAATLAAGRQAIVMVPEIALTPQTIRRFAARFPGRVAVLHSALTEAERAREWRRLRDGELDVVVGSRSAVFAPLPRLGIIVVDEEDAGAYKQDRIPRYHAVDVALERGRLERVPVVLGSATPRVETFYAAHTGGFELVTLDQRISGRPLPPIEVVDLREELRAGNRSPLSLELDRALRDCHEDGGQSILFLNRRGTATVVVCRNCGEALSCDSCSVSLVYHASRRRCDCHYCGASRSLPDICPACGSPSIRGLGMGTERLEVEVHERFPALRLLRMDRDTTSSRDAYFTIYDDFANHRADCLIGTQMVAKGWDLGNVRLVGIVNADVSLHFPDYRSGEFDVLAAHPGGRARRSRRRAGAGDPADLQPRSLRGAPRGDARLPLLRSRGDPGAPSPALPALRPDGGVHDQPPRGCPCRARGAPDVHGGVW